MGMQIRQPLLLTRQVSWMVIKRSEVGLLAQ
jgi:hypothetical protein